MPSDRETTDEIRFDEAPSDDAGARSDETARTNRMLRMARRLLDRKELGQDTRDLLLNVLATSDKAKTEAVRMVAREVRSYLEALELKEDLMQLLTGHSLEISIRLKPVADALQGDQGTQPSSETPDRSTPET